VASFSHVGGTHFQNLHDFEPYLAALRQGRLPWYRACTPTPAERLIREVVLQFKLGRVSRRYFQEKFGVDIRGYFAAALDWLAAEGFLEEDNDWLILTRAGLLQVDRLVHEFFLPEHRHTRYA
jgi:oxygen-independent coproporphyrinogen-3 oxidase